MTIKNALVLIRTDTNGQLLLEDASGKVYALTDGLDALQVLRQIVEDTELPKLDHQPGNSSSFEDVVSKAFEGSIPEPFRPLATMGLSALASRVQRMSSARIRGRKVPKR